MSCGGGRRWLAPGECLGPAWGIVLDEPAGQLARALTAGATSPADAARRLFEHTRDRFRYSYRIQVTGPDDLWSTAVRQRETAFCLQKAVYLTALARSVEIPTALAFQTIVDHTLPRRAREDFFPGGTMRGHTLVAFHIDGRWVRCDPTHDRATAETLDCDLVEFRPGADSFLPERSRSGRPIITVTEDHGLFVAPWHDAVAAAVEGLWQREYPRWLEAFGDRSSW